MGNTNYSQPQTACRQQRLSDCGRPHAQVPALWTGLRLSDHRLSVGEDLKQIHRIVVSRSADIRLHVRSATACICRSLHATSNRITQWQDVSFTIHDNHDSRLRLTIFRPPPKMRFSAEGFCVFHGVPQQRFKIKVSLHVMPNLHENC